MPRHPHLRAPSTRQRHDLLNLGGVAIVADLAMTHLQVSVHGIGVVAILLERLPEELNARIEVTLSLLQHAEADVGSGRARLALQQLV